MSNETPRHLGSSGTRIWKAVTGTYMLRTDELRILEDACAEADLIDSLRATLASMGSTTEGSQGQTVVNPLLPEIRQHRTVLAALMRQLKLPEDGDEEKAAGERSSKAREAAQARWASRGA